MTNEDKLAQVRADFEQWYTTHARNYSRDPIGSRDCSLQWEAWQAAHERAQPASVADGGNYEMFIVPKGEWSDKYGRYVYPAFTDLDTHDDLAAGVHNRWHADSYVKATAPQPANGDDHGN